MNVFRKFTIVLKSCVLLFAPLCWVSADDHDEVVGTLISEGQARAEIVVAADAARGARRAGSELQEVLERITGARLPLVEEPGEGDVFTVFVGRSKWTDALGFDDSDLADGAFRIVAEPGRMVLFGRDRDWQPTEPYTRNVVGPDVDRMLGEWDELTGNHYDNPNGFGRAARRFNSASGMWAYDERGSLNAVLEFLHRLGARWYMPGELGEILPDLDSVEVFAVNETVRPAFGLRKMLPLSSTYFSLDEADFDWQLRLRLNAHSDELGVPAYLSHGLRNVIGREQMKEDHPEYFAVINGERDTARNHACLASPGLVKATADSARALYDVYDTRSVSVMPEDGFTACQCEECVVNQQPERGHMGIYSNQVWEFVDRVARELAETYPDRTVNCFSYGTYTLPPETIEQFSPNVVVGIVHGRGWYFPEPPIQYSLRELDRGVMDVRREWGDKVSHGFVGWEHYPFTHRGTYLPIYFPRAIAAGLAAHAGSSLGEVVEVGWGPFDVRGHGLHSPAFSHLNIYLTARLYWDPDLDIEAFLDEYCADFYGPAAEPMRAFIDYCEANWQQMREEAEPILHAMALFDEARALVDPDSAYGQRLTALDEYLLQLRNRGAQMAIGRGDVPEMRALYVPPDKWDRQIDGQLDSERWERWGEYLMQYRGHPLIDMESGERGTPRTSFHSQWTGPGPAGEWRLGVVCEEPDLAGWSAGDPLPDGLVDDFVEILVETQSHSYYSFQVYPDGRLVDADSQGNQHNTHWTSRAEVATHIGDGFWSFELLVPIPGQDQLSDPLHGLAGRRPLRDLPWYINIGRQRERSGTVQRWVWAPTDGDSIHEAIHFGKLY